MELSVYGFQCLDVVVFLRTVTGVTEASEGSSVTLEAVLQGQVQENVTVTYQLDFANETAISKLMTHIIIKLGKDSNNYTSFNRWGGLHIYAIHAICDIYGR